MSVLAQTPQPPYYAVIFSSLRTEGDNGYAQMADKMIHLAQQQEGFLGVESARETVGITVSYWRDLESIKRWRDHAEHRIAREKGRTLWYQNFKLRIAKIEQEYGFERE